MLASSAETRLLVQPGYRWHVVDGLLTNFHLPRSSLLVLTAAFAGLETVRAAYKLAMEREYRFLRRRGLDDLPKNAAYEDVIHRSNLRSMEYLYERGPIMRLLASDRSIAGLAKRQDRDERGVLIDYFTKLSVEEYGVPPDVARVCSIMTVNAPILSVRALRSSGIAAHRVAEIWSDFIIGGNNALQLKYGKPKQIKTRKRRKALP